MKNGYPPKYTPEVFREVMDQVENFKENYVPTIQKLESVENDRDIRNLIFNRLIMNANTSNDDLQKEVIEEYGTRYPDMKNSDWYRIIADYTPLVREAAQKPSAKIIEMQQYSMAAEQENSN